MPKTSQKNQRDTNAPCAVLDVLSDRDSGIAELNNAVEKTAEPMRELISLYRLLLP